MDSTTVGGKIILIITTILAAVGVTTGVTLSQEQPQESQPPESRVAEQEVSGAKEENQVMNESTEELSSGTYTLEDGTVIEITPPAQGGKLSGPISIKGTVPNSSSKARFIIRVIDPTGKAISNSSVTASNSGSNSGTSTFSTNLNFSTSMGGMGSLQISKDGSGSGDTITIPMEF